MFQGIFIDLLHHVVAWLHYPVIISLLLAIVLLLIELGFFLAERFYTLALYSKGKLARFEAYANKRLERSDLLARCGPILGLMGTLIPLGPGLNALGNGDIDVLAVALSVAFDTTVIGLFVGLIAFIISRLRRRWFENTWYAIESKH